MPEQGVHVSGELGKRLSGKAASTESVGTFGLGKLAQIVIQRGLAGAVSDPSQAAPTPDAASGRNPYIWKRRALACLIGGSVGGAVAIVSSTVGDFSAGAAAGVFAGSLRCRVCSAMLV